MTGFRIFEEGSRFLLVSATHEESAKKLGLLEVGGLERLLEANDRRGPSSGRGRTAVVPLPDGRTRLHLRPVRHGGWLAPVLRDLWLSPARPVAELRANAALYERDAPVPEPILVAGRRRGGLFFSGAVGTRHVDSARDGLLLLETLPSRERLLRAARAAGREVRRFHEVGGCHADLQLANLLFVEEAEETRALVIDLDRARAVSRVEPARRMQELARLYRSLAKRGLLGRVGPEGASAFFHAYTGGDRRFAGDLLAHLPRERRRLALHGVRRRPDLEQRRDHT